MRLNDVPYCQIESGEKTVELRLFDEKRQKIRVGDEIRFVHTDDPSQYIDAKVTAIHRAASFKELLTADMLNKSGFAGYTADEAAESMRQYYTAEDEAAYGVVGIEFKVINI